MPGLILITGLTFTSIGKMINTNKVIKISMGLLFFLYSMCVFAKTFSVEKLLNQISINQPTRLNYSQEQYLHFLPNPVATQGELYFRPPSHIEQHLLSSLQRIVIDKEEMVITSAEGTRKVNLRNYPNVWVMIMTLNALLTHNYRFLQTYYASTVNGSPSAWTLILSPNSYVKNISQIKLTGTKNKVNTMFIQFKNDDWIMQKFSGSDK